MHYFYYILFPILILHSTLLEGQKKSNQDIRQMVQDMKTNDRGPYKDIRWFCDDGSIKMPKEPCGEIGGVQRARYNDDVEKLASINHIFLGQILSTTSINDFWDAENGHSRIVQYQVEKFLRAADDGWIMRKAQFYRGAMQVEDEEAWGIKFFETVLAADKNILENFFLLRQAIQDIPHAGDNDRTQKIRAISKNISESYLPFMNLRVKIHGQPDQTDIAASRAFMDKHKAKLNKQDLQNFDVMLKEMEILYQPLEPESLRKYITTLPQSSVSRTETEQYITDYPNLEKSEERIKRTAQLLYSIRQNIVNFKKGKERLGLMDLSVALEGLLFKSAGDWKPETQSELMDKIYYLSLAAVGCGYLEMWEWEKIKTQIEVPDSKKLNLIQTVAWHEDARRIIEWSSGMTRGVFRPVIELYNGFEPLAYGFYDDQIRSSILLPLGNAVSDLGTEVAREANFSNQVLDLKNQSSFRGLNPGYALGELVVVSGSPDEIEVSKEKIYAFRQPPADLKPVAGIATVTEGNMVSHVQLLARNLGIPNTVLSEQNLKDLEAFNGQRVFYAVSNKGTVIMKREADMNKVERQLFEVKKRSEERIRVPVDKLELDDASVLNLREVQAGDSGKRCGPKAANLGQLKSLFPEKVVEGLVIPFSIFRQHMDQQIPGLNGTYWEFLNNTFKEASSKSEGEAEEFVLGELATFRKAIQQIRFKDDFVKELENKFSTILGQGMGKIPVFLRSDTNMEDLKEFTGAGLNLTLFNVLDKNEILQGIRDVWASPYTERSYKWRQKYLLNPENVYPSILIIPGVNVDYSGVLITKGIPTSNPDDQTIAFSRGVGGAVDGQAAESYLLKDTGENILLSPAREPLYRMLPSSGGTLQKHTSFDRPILNESNLKELRKLTADVNRILPTTPGIESTGPFDIELGFQDDQMWLFQIRPFVENKNATASTYLASITPEIDSKGVGSSGSNNDSQNESSEFDSADEETPDRDKKGFPFLALGFGIFIVGIVIIFINGNKAKN